VTRLQVVTFCLCWISLGNLQAEERDSQIQLMQPGVRLTLVAEHPRLVTPTGIDVDAKGNVWVVASHTHFPPDDYAGPKLDEVILFTKDGKRQVFYNATHHTMDLELGPDGWVYLAERDRILRIRDTNGDGKADQEEDLIVLDTEADYPHNGLAGLSWHPNGDLYFGLGENFSQDWRLTDRDGVVLQGTGEGGILHCSPDGRRLKRIARGLWNPFALCVREDGEIFAADNDPGERPPCRLLHIVEGGDYGFQRLYGSEAHHPFVCWNGELKGTLPMIHPSGEGPCGITPLGQGILVPSWSDHCLNFHPLKRKGASYETTRIELIRGGRYFRPTCIARDHSEPDDRFATWYLADWVDGRYQVHGFGRLWKLQVDLQLANWIGPREPEPATDAAMLASELRGDERSFSLDELFELSRNEDPFIARAALLRLANSADSWKPNEIKERSAVDRASAVIACKLADDPELVENSKMDSAQWITFFLKDHDRSVQFETVRWIADASLLEHLPAIEKLLSRSELNYRLFEAAIAAWNTLSGKPELGVRNLDVLLARVLDSQSDPTLRAYALRLLPTQPRVAKDKSTTSKQFPKGLTGQVLDDLLLVGDSTLSLEVIRTLASNPTVGQQTLARVAADASQPIGLRSDAIAGLSAVAAKHLDLLVRLAGNDHRSIREEALRALRTAGVLNETESKKLRSLVDKRPSSADLVHALLDPDSLAAGRPPVEQTDAWLKRIDSVTGEADAEAGRRIFHHATVGLCSNCHRHDGRGNVVGPDLSRLSANQNRRQLIEAILQPSLAVAPEFRSTLIVLNDGRTFTGIRLRSSTSEVLRDANGQNQSFDRSDIEIIGELDKSFMPDGLVYSLTDRELRDLLAFLESELLSRPFAATK